MELDYHTPKEHTSMKLETSRKALEILEAHINGQLVQLRYKGLGGRWFDIDKTDHTDWNFRKYEYKIVTVPKPTEEERLDYIYRQELGNNFHKVDDGVAVGLYPET